MPPMLSRRAFLGPLVLFAAPRAARAQQSTKVNRIGFMVTTRGAGPHMSEAFLQGLRDLGYVEGDADGTEMATRPCHRCGTPVPVGQTFRLEHLSMIGWRVLEEVSLIERCGHAQHFLVVPREDGERAALVPILGEAA